MAIRVRNVADAPVQALPGRQMVELFSGAVGAAERVTLRIVEIPRLGPPARRSPHEHRDVEECIYVLSGHGLAWIDGETAEVRPGDAVLVPPATPHLLLTRGDTPLRLACFFPTADMPASMVEHPEIDIPEEVLYGAA